ncbi:hypothetical protein QTP88_006539 [Uroleucon formosanum]
MLTPQIVILIIGDGACLFRSISIHLFNAQEIYQEIRNTIVSYVSDNWNNFITMSYNYSNGDNFSTAEAYVREMVNPTVYSGYCELVVAGNIFPFSFQMYYNNNLYAKFGVCHFDVYLSIPNIHNVAVNLITASEGDLSIFNNVSVTENSKKNKNKNNKNSKKRRRARYTDKTRINQVKKAITKYKAIKHQETLGFPTKINLRKWKIKKLSGLAYNPTNDYRNNIVTMNQKCNFYNALKWKGETPDMCCNIGKTQLDPLQPPPEPLRSLLEGNHPDHDHFINRTWKYNSCFQMPSFGVKQIVEEGFMPIFKVQGQVYHLYGSLIPNTQENPQFLQIYFVGEDEEEVQLRCSLYPEVKQALVKQLQNMLHTENKYIRELKTTIDNASQNNTNFQVLIQADRKPANGHKGCYNAATTNEVALVIVGQQFEKRDIIIQSHDNRLQRISELHRYYDALQYPLMKELDIHLLRYGPLFNQYLVDM